MTTNPGRQRPGLIEAISRNSALVSMPKNPGRQRPGLIEAPSPSRKCPPAPTGIRGVSAPASLKRKILGVSTPLDSLESGASAPRPH